jgi:hypothetical protein
MTFCFILKSISCTTRNKSRFNRFQLAYSLQILTEGNEKKKGTAQDTAMENKKIIDKRQIRLEEVMRPDYIPFLGGRPERLTVIRTDDIVNLKINLNTIASVEEFIIKCNQ